MWKKRLFRILKALRCCISFIDPRQLFSHYQAAVEKQGRQCSGSFYTAKKFWRGVFASWPGRAQPSDLGKRPPLVLCLEVTWKAHSGEFSIFPFSSLFKWMFLALYQVLNQPEVYSQHINSQEVRLVRMETSFPG